MQESDQSHHCDRNHCHGVAGDVQCAPPRRHQLCSHRPVRSDQLRVGLRVVLLLHADQRPALGVEHHPHLVALLRWVRHMSWSSCLHACALSECPQERWYPQCSVVSFCTSNSLSRSSQLCFPNFISVLEKPSEILNFISICPIFFLK